MKNDATFYQCNDCNNVLLELNGTISQNCDHNLTTLKADTQDGASEKHVPVIEYGEDLLTVRVGEVPHPMTTDHSILWIYVQTRSGGAFVRLAPEDQPEARFKINSIDVLGVYAYCDIHGLWKAQLDQIDFDEIVCAPEFTQGCVDTEI